VKCLVKSPLAILLLAAGIAVFSPLLSAQTFYGSIIGTITDNSGAVIPGATVTITNLGTSEKKTMESDTQGNYRVLNLIPGAYKVDVEMSGFKRYVREPIQVEVQSAVRIDASLQVGNLTETVEVSSQTPLLQTESTSLSQVVESRKVLEMPLNGRNVYNLVALVPGVVNQGSTFQISGGFARSHAELMDGIPLNSAYINETMQALSQDAVQEFRVSTSAHSVEFGRTAGGVMNLTSRSGTNQFHGSAYDFIRNKVLNASNFFSNKAGAKRAPFTQNQFGATLGGPIIKDKMFFFFSYEGFRSRSGSTITLSVPDPAWKTGDFSDLRDSKGNLIPIYDPLTVCGKFNNPDCQKDASGNPIYTRQQFSGNKIPSNRLDKTAVYLANYIWGAPNQPGQQYTKVNNFIRNASSGSGRDQYNSRVDWNVSDKQRIFVRYLYNTSRPMNIYPFNTEFATGGGRPTATHQVILGDTYSINSTMVADLRLGYNRTEMVRYPDQLDMDLTKVGWPAAMNNQVQFRVLPQPCVQGFDGLNLCLGNSQVVNFGSTNNYFVMPGLSWIKGRHSIKFGADIRVLQFNMAQTNLSSGGFSFDNLFTAVNPYAPAGTGYSFASFMLGFGSSGSVTMNPLISGQIKYQAYYANDTFQATKRLTLNYGVRWELPRGWTERYDRQTVLLADAASPFATAAKMPNLKGSVGLVNSPEQTDRRTQSAPWTLFMPRVGLAYRIGEKTVVRAGYGISTLPNDLVYGAAPNNSPINAVTNPWVPTLDGSLTPANVLSNPFPAGLVQPPGRSPNFNSVLLGTNVFAPIATEPFSYTQQFNVNVERELSEGLLFEVAYGGSRGVHLPAYAQSFDQIHPQYLSLGSKLLEQVDNPFYGIITRGALSTPKISYGQLLRPYPQYTAYGAFDLRNRNSTYHSMQMKVEKRFRQGSSILGAYTWAKNIGDGEPNQPWSESNYGTGVYTVQNSYDLRAHRSLSAFDTPHRLVLSYVLDLPIGKGRKLLGNVSGFLDKFLSGWGLNGITSFQSGFPLGFIMSSDTSNSQGFAPTNGGGVTRPNRAVAGSAAIDGAAQQRLSKWFKIENFSAPAPFTFGNTSRTLGDVRTHGTNNWDFAVFKKTGITEQVQLEFRAEFFNLFNRVQFGYPGMTLGNANFGVVGSQWNSPRQVQMALRLTF
jgi:hypothetical protein